MKRFDYYVDTINDEVYIFQNDNNDYDDMVVLLSTAKYPIYNVSKNYIKNLEGEYIEVKNGVAYRSSLNMNRFINKLKIYEIIFAIDSDEHITPMSIRINMDNIEIKSDVLYVYLNKNKEVVPLPRQILEVLIKLFDKSIMEK